MSQQIAQGPSEVPRTFGFEVHDPQRFAQNMARLVEETGKAVTAFVEPRVSDPTNALVPDDLTRMMNTFSQVQQAWLVQPQKLVKAQFDLWRRYLDLWSSILTAALPGSGKWAR